MSVAARLRALVEGRRDATTYEWGEGRGAVVSAGGEHESATAAWAEFLSSPDSTEEWGEVTFETDSSSGAGVYNWKFSDLKFNEFVKTDEPLKPPEFADILCLLPETEEKQWDGPSGVVLRLSFADPKQKFAKEDDGFRWTGSMRVIDVDVLAYGDVALLRNGLKNHKYGGKTGRVRKSYGR